MVVLQIKVFSFRKKIGTGGPLGRVIISASLSTFAAFVSSGELFRHTRCLCNWELWPYEREPHPLTSPWRVLVAHFWRRFFDTEALSPQSNPEANVVQALGVLATPSAFFVIICQPLDLAGWDQISIRYYFVSFSMLVMAGIVALQWSSLLPDRRDYSILTALPVKLSTTFAAKLMALGIFLGLFLADINCFGALFWPGIDGGDDLLAIMLAHFVTVLAAGLFAALATAALFGALMSVLSPSAFRQVAVAVQTLLIGGIVMLFFLTPLLAGRLRLCAIQHSRFMDFFPPYWYVGLYESFRPVIGDYALIRAGNFARAGLGATVAVSLLSFMVGYRRHARRVLESVETESPGARLPVWASILSISPRTQAQHAIFSFITQTITRSAKHRLFLATYCGFGVAIAVMNLAAGHDGRLRMPLVLTFVLISGLRAAFSFPSELQANWAFQVNDVNNAQVYLSGTRKWIFACGIVPLLVALAPIEIFYFGPAGAAFHIVYGLTISLLLVDIMFIGFRKVPFTCSYFPGKFNLAGLSALYVVGLIFYSHVMAKVEHWLEARLLTGILFFCLCGMVHWGFAIWIRGRAGQASAPDYEDVVDPAVRTLDLTLEREHAS